MSPTYRDQGPKSRRSHADLSPPWDPSVHCGHHGWRAGDRRGVQGRRAPSGSA